jgi:hypothetical protein
MSFFKNTLRLDMFPRKLKINFGGKDHVQTFPGLVMTLVVFAVMIAFT